MLLGKKKMTAYSWVPRHRRDFELHFSSPVFPFVHPSCAAPWQKSGIDPGEIAGISSRYAVPETERSLLCERRKLANGPERRQATLIPRARELHRVSPATMESKINHDIDFKRTLHYTAETIRYARLSRVPVHVSAVNPWFLSQC